MTSFTRPNLYPKQSDAFFHALRWGLTEASTKAGKTVGAMSWLAEKALMGRLGWNYWWVAPGYSQAEIAYRRLKQGLTKGSFTSRDSPTPTITVMSGATLWFKSADNPDALYGEDVYAAVMDEASRCPETSWYALRSTLTATNGPARFIGNVKGRRNWFYDLCRRAESGDLPNAHYSCITAADAVAAGVITQDEIDDARRTLPEAVFRELYFNEPSDDTGNPFGLSHIRACVAPEGLAPGPVVAFGIDLAKSQDFFVVIGLNDSGQVCFFERWNGIPWRMSIRRAWAICGEDAPVLVDSTGVGDPVLEELQFEHGNFVGFMFSPSSKQKLMEGLAVSIQSHEVSFPDGLIRQELENYEYHLTPAGRVTYAGMEGKHDDCVCALALARQMWVERGPSANLIKYYGDLAQRAANTDATGKIEPLRQAPIWRVEESDSEKLDNELTQLYQETLGQALASALLTCAGCGKEIKGSQRVSDGVNVWHTACSGPGARVAA